MGLDLVEIVIRFENAFGISIPDEVAADLTTPRKVTDYIYSQLKHGERSSLAFHKEPSTYCAGNLSRLWNSAFALSSCRKACGFNTGKKQAGVLDHNAVADR